jgi:hypothetical protein
MTKDLGVLDGAAFSHDREVVPRRTVPSPRPSAYPGTVNDRSST